MGRAQSIQCAVMQHTTAMDCCHMRPRANTHLLNPPIGYPVGCVQRVVLLAVEPTIRGGCLLLFKLALCYWPHFCSK